MGRSSDTGQRSEGQGTKEDMLMRKYGQKINTGQIPEKLLRAV